MNKKFYLGAILLGAMTLSTGALTSCIDNDEPEGITNLRGAKAELLRAKAALELAKAETEKQNANLVAAKAAVEQANAKIAEAIAKQEEAKAKQEEAKVAYEQAKSDKAKAEALEALAAAETAQAEAEAALAEIKAQSELNLQNIKNDLLAAQNRYDQLVAEIEAAKAVLTDEQAQKLASLQGAVDAAWTAYTDQQGVVLGKMQELFDATNGEIDQEESLRDALAGAESHLAAVTAVYDELKALSENVAPTAWEARMDSLKAYGDGTTGTSALEIAELNLKLTEIKQSEAYKTAEKEDDVARRAYVTAQQLYNYLADEDESDCFDNGGAHDGSWEEQNLWGYYEDGTHPTAQAYTEAKMYDLDGAKIAITNPEVYNKLNAQLTALGYATSLKNDWQGMRLQVDGTYVIYNGGEKYSKLKYAFNVKGLPESNITKTVAAWTTAIGKIKVTDEEIAADSCVADYEKAVLAADSIHKSKVEVWKKAHKTYSEQKVAESVSTATIKAAIGLYNANIDALEAAVTAYNTTYDATLTSLYNKNLEAAKITFAYTEINAAVTVGTVPTTYTTLAQIDAFIDLSSLSATDKADMKTAYRLAMNNKWATQTLADITTAENTAMSTAQSAVASDEDVVNAGKKITNSEGTGILDKITKLDGGWNDNDKVYTGSYATIAKAVTDFIAAAGKNSEKQTSAAQNASTTAKQEGYTGVAAASAKKYINGGTKDLPNYASVTTSMWVENKYELNDAEVYVTKGHKQVVRTKVSDEAIKAMTAVELDKQKAGENWVEASAAAFGSSGGPISVDPNSGKVLTTTGARHTELTADMITKNGSNYYDENGEMLTNWATSSLKTLVDAKQALADHKNLEGVNAEIDSLKTLVAEAKAAMLAQIAEYTAAVNEAKAAIEPAKKEHQAKHKAAEALLKPVQDEIDKINATATEYADLASDLQNILNAYYAVNDFSYIDENGVKQSISWGADKDFGQVVAWLKDEISNYETAIETAEDEVAQAQKNLDRWIADGDFDAVAQAQIALDNAQAYLETLKTRYDFALSQLNDYVAALSK